MAREGLLVQPDGSRHDWLGERGPRLTLIGLVDDATDKLLGATFRLQEDTTGYLVALHQMVRRHGVPAAVYRDRHTLFEASRQPLTLEEQLADIDAANVVLGRFPAALQPPLRGARSQPRAGLADAGAGRRSRSRLLVPLPPRGGQRPHGARARRSCSLPPGPGRRGYAGRRVELQVRLDGRLAVFDGERQLLSVTAPSDPAQLRSLHAARQQLTVAPPVEHSHPWRQVRPGSKLYRQIREQGLTKSQSS
jgi:hypothetical protein